LETSAGGGTPQPQGYVAGAGRGDGGTAKGEKDTSNEENLNDSTYDEFGGYTEKLFNNTPYEKDDEEADKIWQSVDNIMDTRRKRQREESMLKTMKKFRKERPKISDQFADLKRNLSTVSQEEWDAIPEVGDYASLRLRQKRQQLEKFSPMPDNIINGAAQQNAARSALDSRQQRYGGMETPIGGMSSVVGGGMQSVLSGMRSVGGTTSVFGGTQSVFRGGASTALGGGLAEARGTVLGLKLDKMSDSVTGQTVVDPKG
jgi:pre-mRNA-processing factor 6